MRRRLLNRCSDYASLPKARWLGLNDSTPPMARIVILAPNPASRTPRQLPAEPAMEPPKAPKAPLTERNSTSGSSPSSVAGTPSRAPASITGHPVRPTLPTPGCQALSTNPQLGVSTIWRRTEVMQWWESGRRCRRSFVGWCQRRLDSRRRADLGSPDQSGWEGLYATGHGSRWEKGGNRLRQCRTDPRVHTPTRWAIATSQVTVNPPTLWLAGARGEPQGECAVARRVVRGRVSWGKHGHAGCGQEGACVVAWAALATLEQRELCAAAPPGVVAPEGMRRPGLGQSTTASSAA